MQDSDRLRKTVKLAGYLLCFAGGGIFTFGFIDSAPFISIGVAVFAAGMTMTVGATKQ